MTFLHFITSLRTGGAEHLLVDLLPRLRDMGHSVELLLLDGTRTPFYEQLEGQGIAIHSLGMGTGAMHNPLLLFRLKAHLKKHHYDIVHTHNTPCQLLMAMAGRINNATLVTTEHNTSNLRRAWGWYKRIDRWMYGKYAKVICISPDVKKALCIHLGEEDNKYITIYNGIDTAAYAAFQHTSKEQLCLPEGKVILMVAAFRYQKDQQTLIRALSLLPSCYFLVFVGDGEKRKDCELLTTNLNMTKRVDFLGNRRDVASLMQVADVVVQSSHIDGFCLAAVEGMASGKPVIASDVPGLRDIVGGAGLLFPHGDHRRLAELIRRVCEDDTFSRQVAARCRERAMQYDIARMAAGYAQTYQEITKQN